MTTDLSEAAWFKSSYSDGNGGTCVEVADLGAWFKSSYSDENGGTCVEVADLSNRVGVRDSKDAGIAPFTVTKAAWASFIDQLRQAD